MRVPITSREPADKLRNQMLRGIYDNNDIAKYLKGG